MLGVVTATIAAWFVRRLQDVEEADDRTAAALAEVLAELRQLRARVDALRDQPAGRPGGTAGGG